MQFLKFLLLVLPVVAGAGLKSREHYERMFMDWQKDYNINFSTGEEWVERLEIFSENVDKMILHNKLVHHMLMLFGRGPALSRLEQHIRCFVIELLAERQVIVGIGGLNQPDVHMYLSILQYLLYVFLHYSVRTDGRQTAPVLQFC